MRIRSDAYDFIPVAILLIMHFTPIPTTDTPMLGMPIACVHQGCYVRQPAVSLTGRSIREPPGAQTSVSGAAAC